MSNSSFVMSHYKKALKILNNNHVCWCVCYEQLQFNENVPLL